MPQQSPAQRILAELRVQLFAAGVSLSALARSVGTSPSGVSRRFTGEVPVTLDELEQYAEHAGLRVDVRLEPAPTNPVASPTDGPQVGEAPPTASPTAPLSNG